MNSELINLCDTQQDSLNRLLTYHKARTFTTQSNTGGHEHLRPERENSCSQNSETYIYASLKYF